MLSVETNILSITTSGLSSRALMSQVSRFGTQGNAAANEQNSARGGRCSLV
jgi:hypothetical protein